MKERAVSKRHAEIVTTGETYTIQDLNSRNHTELNSQDIYGKGPQTLNDGDRISICGFEFVFQNEESSIDSSSSIVFSGPADEARITVSSAIPISSRDSSTSISSDAKFNALLEITRCLSHALELDQVLTKTLDCLCKIFPAAERAFIGLLDESAEFAPKWWTTRPKSDNDIIRVSRTIIDRVLASQEAVHIEDIKAQFPSADSVKELPVRSTLCAPLIDGDSNSFGVIQVDATLRSFLADDLEVLAGIAGQIALAINYARMHEAEIQRHAIEKELAIAREVQFEFLPDSPPAVEGYEFFDYYAPARQIGGDYFDYVELRDGRIAVVVADVCGKGIPAALFMVRLVTETRACLKNANAPADVLAELSHRFTNKWVTMSLAVLDPRSHTVTLAGAGHKAPVLRTQDGATSEPSRSVQGLPFSAEMFEYGQETVRLEPGESLTLYTDGFDDAENPAGHRFGHERIERIIQESPGSAEHQVTSIIDAAQSFMAEHPQSDDMCLVCLRRLDR